MAIITTKPKLKFPGMLDEQYEKHREQLVLAEVAAKTAAKALVFKSAADKVLPRWEG